MTQKYLAKSVIHLTFHTGLSLLRELLDSFLHCCEVLIQLVFLLVFREFLTCVSLTLLTLREPDELKCESWFLEIVVHSRLRVIITDVGDQFEVLGLVLLQKAMAFTSLVHEDVKSKLIEELLLMLGVKFSQDMFSKSEV